jgi:hypothetical protein
MNVNIKVYYIIFFEIYVWIENCMHYFCTLCIFREPNIKHSGHKIPASYPSGYLNLEVGPGIFIMNIFLLQTYSMYSLFPAHLKYYLKHEQ